VYITSSDSIQIPSSSLHRSPHSIQGSSIFNNTSEVFPASILNPLHHFQQTNNPPIHFITITMATLIKNPTPTRSPHSLIPLAPAFIIPPHQTQLAVSPFPKHFPALSTTTTTTTTAHTAPTASSTKSANSRTALEPSKPLNSKQNPKI